MLRDRRCRDPVGDLLESRWTDSWTIQPVSGSKAGSGWNPRDPATGGEGQIINMLGTTLLFATTASERIARGDPRPAIFERYRDRADYLACVRSAAQALAADRYILAEDVDLAVEIAAERFDWLVSAPALTQESVAG